MSKELLKASVPIPAQSTPPSPFQAQIVLEILLTNLTVNSIVAQLSLAGMFLGQICSQAGMEVYSKCSSEEL